MLRKLTIFIFLLTGFAWSFSVSAANCPMDNGAGVGCNAGNNEYYCGSACRQLSAGTTPTLNFCQNNFQVCAPGVDCSNSYAAAFPCGVPQACNGGFTLCNIAGTGASSFPDSKCKANASIPAGCSTYNQCTNVCSACSAGYELLAGNCIGATVRLGTDSVMSDRLKNSTMPLMSILSSGNVGIGTTDPNDIFSIGNSGSAPLGSVNTGHNYTSTYLSADDYALVNYGLVKTLIDSATSSSALWGGIIGGNVWNLNSGNVGIGTTSPLFKLHLSGGDFRSEGTFRTGVSGQPGRWRFYDSSGYLMSFWDGTTDYDTWGLYWDTADNEFRWMGNGTMRSSIDLDDGSAYFQGNVGIGTTTPGYLLDVFAGSSAVARFGNPATGNTVFAPNGLEEVAGMYAGGVRYAFGRDLISNGSAGVGFSNFSTPGLNKFIGNDVNNNLGFFLNGTSRNNTTTNEYLTITTAGNVGIGTVAPNDKLSIGNSGTAPVGSLATGHNFTSTYLTTDDYALTNYGIVKSLISSSATTNALWNGTKNGNIWNGDAGAGNVGIGTTNPSSALHVKGGLTVENLTSTSTAVLSFTQPNYGRLNYSISPNNGKSEVRFVSKGATGGTGNTYFVIASTESLDTGNNLLMGVAASRAFLTNSVNYNNAGTLHLGGNSWAGDGVVQISGIPTDTTGKMTVMGNVGIGTTTPAYKLDVVGNVKSKGNFISYDGNNFGGASFYSSYNYTNGEAFIKPAGSSNPTVFSPNGGVIIGPQTSNPPTNGLLVSGNLGIGTTIPNDIFSIGNSGSAPIGSDHTGHNYTMSYLTSDPYALVNYGTTMSLINAATSSSSLWGGTKNGNIWNGDAGAGNVGIGTTNPSSLLTVGGGGNNLNYTLLLNPANNDVASLALVSTGGNGGSIFFGSSGATNGEMTYNFNVTNAFEFFGSANKTNRLLLLAPTYASFSGNVGIGTTAPNDIFSIGNSGVAPIGSLSTGHNYTMTYLSSDQYALMNYGATMSLINAATSSMTTYTQPMFATSTAATYNGSQGATYSGANALCAAASAGSHVCTTGEIFNTINSGHTADIPLSTLWINNGPPGYTANANDCMGWSNAAGTNYGTVWIKTAGNDGFGSLQACSNTRKYACCK